MNASLPSRIVITVLLILIAATMLLPFIWMISASMKYEVDVFKYPIEWIPSRFRIIENYSEVWMGAYSFALLYWNSIKVTLLSTLLMIVVSTMAAYGFAFIRFRFKRSLFMVYIATLMVPIQITLVPTFVVIRYAGIYDTHLSLILIGAFNAFAVFMPRQNMLIVPPSIFDSAKIDGASHAKIYLFIVLPMVRAAIAVLAILKFTWSWNNYQHALIFLRSKHLYTIQLGLKQFSDQYGTAYSLVMAGAVSAIFPLIIVFLLGQKYIIRGITLGSVKG